MGEWIESCVNEIAAPVRNALVGGPFGSDLVKSDYTSTGVPVIRGENLGDNRWVCGEFVFVSPAKAERLSANTAAPGDIVFTQRGAYHYKQIAIVPKGPYQRYLVSQSQMKLTVDRTKADPLFVYYWFRTAEQQEYLQRNAISTGVPHTNLGILRNAPIRLPTVSKQHAIAHILGALDDKIELNRRMNETLEAMARALFKSWFVDFDPVRAKAAGRAPSGMDAETAKLFPSEFVQSDMGEIPRGWTIESLDAIADFRNGLALQKFRPAEGEPMLPVVKIAQLRTGRADSGEWARADIPSDCILDNGDVIFSWSGSLTVVVWCGGRAALNQHLFRVTSSQFPKWFYLQWLLYHLPEFQRIAGDKATTMGHIQRYHLTAAKCIVPTKRVLEAMSAMMAPLVEKHIQLDLESRTLALTRDELLPRLLSGELSVAEAEAFAEGNG